MRIAFAGTPNPALPTLQALINSHHQLDFVITRPDAAKGRGRVMAQSPVAELAQENGIECIKTNNLSEISDRIAQVDCVVVVAFGGMVPEELLTVPKHGWVNVHFSLLPHWRGAAPVQHAILAGDEITGVTTFQIDSGLDTGPILGHVATSIAPNETSGELLERLSHLGAHLLLQTLDGLEVNMLYSVAQTNDGVTRAPKITSNDARINWSHPALAISRRVRAMTPDPGAWTMCAEKRIKIGSLALETDVRDLGIGEVALRDGKVLVGTGSHALWLKTLQEEGRTMNDALVWLNQRENVIFE